MSDEKSKNPHSIGDVVDGLEELADEEDEVKFADVLDKFGSRSFAPIMLLLALIQLSPVGAIPGLPTAIAVCIALIAVQLLFGRDHIWVPGWIENRSVSADKLKSATGKIDGIASKLDALAKGRLKFLTRGAAIRLAAGIILFLCMLVPPLEVLPWAAAGPMAAIAVMSLAIMVRDGLAMLIAWLLSLAAVGAMTYWYFTSDSGGGSFLPF